MRERSCIPYGDAGLIKALINHNVVISKQDLAGMDNIFKEFNGWESYLVFYLWRSLCVDKY
jgi:DNA-3-methyladenine glycosylase II